MFGNCHALELLDFPDLDLTHDNLDARHLESDHQEEMCWACCSLKCMRIRRGGAGVFYDVSVEGHWGIVRETPEWEVRKCLRWDSAAYGLVEPEIDAGGIAWAEPAQ